MALVDAAGGEAQALGIAKDRLDDVESRLCAALIAGADAIVVSGGVSVGPYDVVKLAFEKIGRIDVWRVAVQPGKPFAFGVADRPDGGRTLLFGLPGNPVSSFVTFELFVRPAIRALAGHRRGPAPPAGGPRGPRRARLEEPRPTRLHPGRRRAGRRPASPVRDERGRVAVRLAGGSAGQGSHVISALAAADALAVIPEAHDTLDAGADVELWWLDTGLGARRMRWPETAAPRAERRRLTHVDRSGRPRMVDVTDKAVTARRAVAEALVAVSAETMSLVIDGGGPKGDVLGVAELAGVMARQADERSHPAVPPDRR